MYTIIIQLNLGGIIIFSLKEKDTIALVSSSNGLDLNLHTDIENLKLILNSFNINIAQSKYLFKNLNNLTYDGYLRANDIMNFFKDSSIKAIFDLSGGDLCNEVLRFLDFELITKNYKPYFGYSDVSVLLNSLYSKSNIISYNYQLRNIIKDTTNKQISLFKNTFFYNKNDLFKFKYTFLQGNTLEGVVIGGNIRCFLKLCGTKYMPDFNNKILFLESLGGDLNKISTFIEQYNQIGAFDKINGILLGEFTELEKNYELDFICNYLLRKINKDNIPIVKTQELGHSANSKAIAIGQFLSLKKFNI